MKRFFTFAPVLLFAACQTTPEAGGEPTVDLAALQKDCQAEGASYAQCASWADALLREDATKDALAAALAEVEPYCTVDEPSACQAAHALWYRMEQPRDDGSWSPVTDGNWQYEPRALGESPKVGQVKAALLDEAWRAAVKTPGVIAVAVSVKEDGQLQGVEVAEGKDPVLDRLAMQAALDGRYLPGRTQDGAFRDGVVTVRFDFSLPEPPAGDEAPPPLEDDPPEASDETGDKPSPGADDEAGGAAENDTAVPGEDVPATKGADKAVADDDGAAGDAGGGDVADDDAAAEKAADGAKDAPAKDGDAAAPPGKDR